MNDISKNDIKSFIKSLLSSTEKRVREEERKKAMQDINDIIWNKDGSLKSHKISDIVSSVMHYFIR